MRRMPLAFLLLSCARGGFAAGPRIAVIIDDFGLTYERNASDEEWMRLPFPMTFAVMPESPRTRQAAEAAKQAGKELIIHFPFDPFLSLELDQDAAMEEDKKKVRALLDKALRDIPGAVGLSNHRSHRATRNRPLMRWFMGEIKARGLYFIDSRVSDRTVACDEAKRAGVPTRLNAVFIDTAGLHTKEFCGKMLRRGAAQARKQGSAVIIGHHYFHGTYDCLKDGIPELRREGLEFVFASQLVR